MSSSDFNADFRVLGLAPTENWSKVKSAYRKLARKWHPDRYTDSGTEKNKAEEKLKDINLAYTRLSNYYKEHGRLPPKKKAPSPRAPEYRQDHRRPQAYKGHAKTKTEPEPDRPEMYSRKPEANNQNRKSGKIIFIIVIISLFLALQDYDLELPPQTRKNTGTTEKILSQSPAKITKPQQTMARYFTYGSTLGKVHSVQGVPTKTEGDVWYYGKSEVIFEKGRVVKWIIDPDTPLNASATKISNKILFGYGSSANDVLRAQGRPSHMIQNLWVYGLSKVYFEDGLVIRWYSSSSDPLNVTE